MKSKADNLSLSEQRRAGLKQIFDKIGIDEDGQRRLSGLMDIFQKIEERHKGELWPDRKYAIRRGGDILEGTPSELGFPAWHKVPEIFEVRYFDHESENFVGVLAYCLSPCCVSEGATRQASFSNMRLSIENAYELQDKTIPTPLIMEIKECNFHDLKRLERLRKRQSNQESFWREEKQWQEDMKRMKQEVDDPGRSRLVGAEE